MRKVKRYGKVIIERHYSGFQMWQAQINEIEFAWENKGDLLADIHQNNYNCNVLELGKDELPEDVQDIRGRVHNEATLDQVFVILPDNKEEAPIYFGIASKKYQQEAHS